MYNTIKSLTAQASSEEEKVAILYRYMQQNMRYVSVKLGIGGWQTFDATYVEQNKYGDCKALSNFMKAMLKVIDIPAYTVLVYAGESRLPYEVEEDFSFPRFNHVILHIPKLNYWLECTNPINPPNYLGSFTSDRNVLLVTEEGGKLIRTPRISNDLNRKISATEIHLETTGAATIKNSIQYGGTLQDDWRYYFLKKERKN
ncbi:MAG: transglutaminase domain-containing protein [Saprospiraceae bacterium]|nr:transglutaminase domain-containing protein [Saprospiraceae bacterium]